MTQEELSNQGDRWVDGSLESGADPLPSESAVPRGSSVPNPKTGVGIGAGAGSSFEPEEDREPADEAGGDRAE
jgi:hypothetical protein